MHQFIPKEVVCAIVLLVASALAVKSETVPLPRARPPVLEDQTSAPKIESERSPCQLQLSEIAEFKSMPPITGPGECTATDVVNVNAVLLPGNQRVVFSPVVTLQCSMAEVVSHWIRDDVAPPGSRLVRVACGHENESTTAPESAQGILQNKIAPTRSP